MSNPAEFDVDNATRDFFKNEYRLFRSATTLLERETNSLSVLSLDELRSAIDHLARAHDPEKKPNAEKEMQKAKMHLLRGATDAKQAVIYSKIEKLSSLPLPVSHEVVNIRQSFSDLLPKIRAGNITIAERLRLLEEMDVIINQAEKLLTMHKAELGHTTKNESRGNFWRAVLWVTFGALLSAFASYVSSSIKF